MSKIALEPNASGTGTFTIASPNSNTSRTLTLPDAAGELLTDGSSLDAGKLTGALPAIDGSALTGISTTPTTAQVLSATAGLTAGGVGTYTFAYYAGYTYFGSTYAGSSIYPAAMRGMNGTTGNGSFASQYMGSNTSAQAGTWRSLGGYQTYDTEQLTLFVRIS